MFFFSFFIDLSEVFNYKKRKRLKVIRKLVFFKIIFK